MEKRVMIVDDEPDILKALKIVLEDKNFDVITVETGKECIKEIKKGFKGVILLDIMMPEMDGWDTLKEIIKLDLMQDIAIEIITGKGTKDHEKIIGLQSYIHDYLIKPMEIEELIESLNKCLENLEKIRK